MNETTCIVTGCDKPATVTGRFTSETLEGWSKNFAYCGLHRMTAQHSATRTGLTMEID